jgi:hypothetical protein
MASKNHSTWSQETKSILIICNKNCVFLSATSSEEVEYKWLPSCPDDENRKEITQVGIFSYCFILILM